MRSCQFPGPLDGVSGLRRWKISVRQPCMTEVRMADKPGPSSGSSGMVLAIGADRHAVAGNISSNSGQAMVIRIGQRRRGAEECPDPGFCEREPRGRRHYWVWRSTRQIESARSPENWRREFEFLRGRQLTSPGRRQVTAHGDGESLGLTVGYDCVVELRSSTRQVNLRCGEIRLPNSKIR